MHAKQALLLPLHIACIMSYCEPTLQNYANSYVYSNANYPKFLFTILVYAVVPAATHKELHSSDDLSLATCMKYTIWQYMYGEICLQAGIHSRMQLFSDLTALYSVEWDNTVVSNCTC